MAKLKFGFMPGHWGLKGRTREIAKAEYELEGFELKQELLRISADDYTTKEYRVKNANLLLEFGKIDKLTHLRMLAELIEDQKQKDLALMELDYKEGKITEIQYQKQSATLKGEPWVTVISMDFGGKKSLEGSFELDWNDLFVENLKQEGYLGLSDDSIVNQWFMEVCRNVAMEEFDGTGDFTADSAANLETMRRWNSVEPVGNDRKGYR